MFRVGACTYDVHTGGRCKIYNDCHIDVYFWVRGLCCFSTEAASVCIHYSLSQRKIAASPLSSKGRFGAWKTTEEVLLKGQPVPSFMHLYSSR